MKKVEILSQYNDTQLNRIVMPGEILEVDDQRAITLVNHQGGIARYYEVDRPPSQQEELEVPDSLKQRIEDAKTN